LDNFVLHYSIVTIEINGAKILCVSTPSWIIITVFYISF